MHSVRLVIRNSVLVGRARRLCRDGLLSLAVLAGVSGTALANDWLYVGDAADNTVQWFSALTGRDLGTFVPATPPGVDCTVEPRPAGCIIGPRGMIVAPATAFRGPRLLLANQNANLPVNGEILSIRGPANITALVKSGDPNGPVGPRGIVLSKDFSKLFVADIRDPGETGAVKVFSRAGDYITDLPTPPLAAGKEFHPRGLVIGPDGLLYVANAPVLPPPFDIGGQVFRYDPETLTFIDAFIDDAGGLNRLNRPEGLVFGPGGRLYITSFVDRTQPDDRDQILIFDGPLMTNPGKRVGQIPLWTTGQPRVFAEALLFGPGNRLFVPISGGPDAGQVRRYRVKIGAVSTYDVFIPAAASGGPIGAGWYLTFQRTNPATLAYGG